MDHESVEEYSSCDFDLLQNLHKVFDDNLNKRKAKAEVARMRAEHEKEFRSQITVQ